MIDRTQQPEVSAITQINWTSLEKRQLGKASLHGLFFNEDVFKLEVYFPKNVVNLKSSVYAMVLDKWLKEGTLKRSGKDFFEEVDILGGGISVGSNNDHFVFTVSGLSKNFSELFGLLKEMIFQPKLGLDEFEKVRSIVKQQFVLSLEKVEVLARRKTAELLYQDIPAYQSKTEAETFDEITADEVKEHFEHVIKAVPHLFFTGEEAIFQTIEFESDCEFVSEVNQNQTPQFFPDIIRVEKKDAVQSAIRISKLTISPTHEDFIPFSVGIVALGGYFESRLNKNIREDKGYTYGIHAGVQTLRQATFFGVITQVGNEHTDNTFREIEKEIRLLQTELMSETELADVKSYISGSLLRAADGPMMQMEVYKDHLLYNLPVEILNTQLEEVEKATPEQVKLAMEKHLQWDSLLKVVAG